MPRVDNALLTLTRVGAKVTIVVKYKAVFSPFDLHMVGLGVSFVEIIAVMGMDPPGALTGRVLIRFDNEEIPVTAGKLEYPRERTLADVLRIVLDEDQNPFFSDPDEIRCRIQILASNLTPRVTPDAFTNQQVLDDGVFQP